MVLCFTFFIVFSAATGFFVGHSYATSLLLEMMPLAIMTAIFSILTGFVSSGKKKDIRKGSIGGADNALINMGVLLLVASIFDRHFVSIGGRQLFFALPVYPLIGSPFGMMGAYLRNLMSFRRGEIKQ